MTAKRAEAASQMFHVIISAADLSQSSISRLHYLYAGPMRYRNEITICADPRFVWQVFDDPESICQWQPTLKTQTHLAGVPGEVGSVYELVFDNDGREVKAVATLTERRELQALSSTIDSQSSIAKVVNLFEPVGDRKTRWIFDIEYRFKGLYKIVSIFFGKSLRARADDEMRNIKQLVESKSFDD